MWLTRLYTRSRDLAHEMGKFGIVGAIAWVVDTALFTALLLTMESETTAKILATAVAATVAFVGNRFWTWRHRARSGLAREYGLYFLFNAVGLGISLVILRATHHGLGAVWPVFQTPLADVISANVIGLAAGTAFRFWSYRQWVFRHPPATAPEPATEAVAPEAANDPDPTTAPEPTVAVPAPPPATPDPAVANGHGPPPAEPFGPPLTPAAPGRRGGVA